jgi:hypothetical protein
VRARVSLTDCNCTLAGSIPARGVDHVFVQNGCFERHGMYGHNDDLMVPRPHGASWCPAPGSWGEIRCLREHCLRASSPLHCWGGPLWADPAAPRPPVQSSLVVKTVQTSLMFGHDDVIVLDSMVQP